MRVYGAAPGTSDAVLHTVTVPCTDFSIVLSNTTGLSATVTLNLYPAGGSTATDNEVVPAISIAAHSIFIYHVPLGLEVGDIISGLQGTGSACNVFIDVTPKL